MSLDLLLLTTIETDWSWLQIPMSQRLRDIINFKIENFGFIAPFWCLTYGLTLNIYRAPTLEINKKVSSKIRRQA